MCIRDSSTAVIYVDGVAKGTNSGITVWPSTLGNTTNNWLGRSEFEASDTTLVGSLDEFRIYNRALTAADVAQLNAGGPSQTYLAGTVTLSNTNQTYDCL